MPSQSDEAPVDQNAIDVALMLRVRDDDMDAFEQLVERHQHAVVGTVTKMLNSNADAEDIAQQVFIRLWKSAKRYQEQAKFTTFLYTITKNLVFNESKKRARRKQVSIEERSEDSHLEIADHESRSPDNTILEAELRDAINTAISQLPEKQRLAVILRRYEQLSYEEIAEVLGLTVSAVKSQLFRARTSLKELLSTYLSSS